MKKELKGLTIKEVENRVNNNLLNKDISIKYKSNTEIILKNIFTLFNILNFIFAILLISVNSYKNLLFMGVVISNMLISIIEELKAKKIISKLSIASKEKLNVLRSSSYVKLYSNEIVMDDLIRYTIGNQIALDSIIEDGIVEVDESFITGESTTITKSIGDTLLSGSFIVSGTTISRVIHINEDNFMYTITKDAKKMKKVKSEIISSFNKIIKIMSIIIFPLGILLYIHQLVLGSSNSVAIVNTIGALISMIPEGLILLSSTVFALSIIKLSKKNILVQDLYSIETLARIDTLCLDKTGTITDNEFVVKDTIILDDKYNINEVMGNFCYSFNEENATIRSLKNNYIRINTYELIKTIPFSSERKYSKVFFKEMEVVLGAPNIIDKNNNLNKYITKYEKDYRLLLLSIDDVPSYLFLLEDRIKKGTEKIIQYFNELNVSIKIISGDSPVTVSNIAKKIGIINYKNYIDVSTLKDKDYSKLIKEYTIFGRTKPDEKRELIAALKKEGRTVAMTGDGVNDVLALKESNIAIGFSSGMEASRNVSQIVLLDNEFTHVIDILKEGRRSINNIEKSSSLFLTKTIFATILAIVFIFLSIPYPFIPIQLTLTSTLTFGITSVLLALLPNYDLVRGKFLKKVLISALPASITMAINVIIISVLSLLFKIDMIYVSTMCVISNAFIGFNLLFIVSKPFDNPYNTFKTILYFSMITIFLVAVIFLKNLFSLQILDIKNTILISIILFISYFLFKLFRMINMRYFLDK